VLAGVVFCLLCAPAVLLLYLAPLVPAVLVAVLTVPPAWAALLALEARIAEDRKANLGTMLAAWPRLWTRSVGLGLLAAFPFLVGLLTLPLLSAPQVPTVVWVGLAADAFGLLLLAALYVYAFPLLALHDLGVGVALRNALILSSRHILNTLGLLAMAVLFGFGVAYISPGLLVILPPIWGLFIINNCRMVVAEELERSGASSPTAGDDRR